MGRGLVYDDMKPALEALGAILQLMRSSEGNIKIQAVRVRLHLAAQLPKEGSSGLYSIPRLWR